MSLVKFYLLWFLCFNFFGNVPGEDVLEYVVVFLPQTHLNPSGGENLLYILSPVDTLVSIENAYEGSHVHSIMLQGNRVRRIRFRSSQRTSLGEFISPKAVHIRSIKPLTITGFNFESSSSDSFAVLPLTGGFTQFRAVSYTEKNVHAKCVLSVASIHDRITIQITSTQWASFRYNERFYTDGETLRVELRRLQVLQVESQDVTGLLVTSHAPIAVYSGCSCVPIPKKFKDNCNHIVEQIPPINSWGSEFISGSLAPRRAGDIFRIVASCNNTEVIVNDSPVGLLHEGGFLDFQSKPYHAARITCGNSCMVALFLQGHSVDQTPGEPAMVILPHTGEYTSSVNLFQFFSHKNKTVLESAWSLVHRLMVIVKTENSQGILLDNKVLGSGKSWSVVPGSGYSVCSFRISAGLHELKHTNSETKFAVLSYGLGVGISYAHSMPIEFKGRDHTACAHNEPHTLIDGRRTDPKIGRKDDDKISSNHTAVILLVCVSVLWVVTVSTMAFFIVRFKRRLRWMASKEKVIIVPRPVPSTNSLSLLNRQPVREGSSDNLTQEEEMDTQQIHTVHSNKGNNIPPYLELS